ncbi:hypothetical protein N3K66_002416 [Trichothecium roseum]|uniref:Uncharacterized protein n=1 Tax=Trichothecium roseum TaxID=47278 RepID=A0ACC0V9T4_9HYPO|nr:hypothetical protein N3K66_002416 [Trichothecium roseum]
MLVPPQVASAEASTTTISVYDASSTYTYHGCYSGTTTGRSSSDGSRRTERGAASTAGDPDSSSGAVTKVSLTGEMTVPKCLDLCSRESEQYRYVRLQSARECRCSHTLAGVASRLDDSACDLACEGDGSMACGGSSSQLSLYKLQSDDWSPSRISGYIAITGLALAVL